MDRAVGLGDQDMTSWQAIIDGLSAAQAPAPPVTPSAPASTAPATSPRGVTIFKDMTAGINSAVAAIAVSVGGYWAYFKFIRERPYHPRLEVGLQGKWIALLPETPAISINVTVKNIGTSRVDLLQHGTGLRVSELSDTPAPPPKQVSWESGKVYPVFEQHAWIEPNETIADQIVVRVSDGDPVPALLQCRLVWRRSTNEGNISILAKEVVYDVTLQPAESTDDTSSQNQNGADD